MADGSSARIFRSYDIRGIYKKDIDEKTMEGIGNVLGQFADGNFVVGMDMRISSQKLHDALVNGITATKDVHDLGLVPIGVAMFYAMNNKMTLAYVTASHLPKEWNGVKFFHPDGMGFVEEENLRIRNMFLEGKIVKDKKGKMYAADSQKAIEDYKNYLVSKISFKNRLRVVLDCGNGMASIIAPQLFTDSGCEVFTIFDKLDGTFPGRDSEPTEASLSRLMKEVRDKKADIGIAYDGDADRMLLVDDMSRSVNPEQTAYIILSDLLKKENGPIVANVECTKLIDDVALLFKRKIFRCRVGHPYLVQEAKSRGASFGLERSGHFVLPSMAPFDDALAVSLYAVYALSNIGKKLSSLVDEIPKYYFERINFKCPDEKKFYVIQQLKKHTKAFENVTTMDGLRLDFSDGWVLIRASNTEPTIRITIEGKTQQGFEELKEKFTRMLTLALEA